MRHRNWSDNDHHFGPFTYAKDDRYRPVAAVINSGHDEHPGCHLRLSGFGHTLIIELPPVIRPWRRWVDISHYHWAKAPGFWEEGAREYGFSLAEGFLNVKLGRQTHDSETEQRWGYFLPWTQWRHVRHSLYDTEGAHFWTQIDRGKGTHGKIMDFLSVKEECPSVSFEFEDYDGECITAKTVIEEREWHFGEGWFKWLSLFRKPKISRCLEIEFSAETGPRKGSWKGGTIGHAIEMLPGELHEDAFIRYCAAHDMRFIGQRAHVEQTA